MNLLLPTAYSPLPTDCRASRRGQSLIEAIVAITVLTTGFLGISSLLARSYFLNRVVSDQITANYLASEGIEIAKNLIDHGVHESLPAPGGGGNPASFSWGTCFSQYGNPEKVELDYTTTGCDTLGLPQFTLPGRPLLFDPQTYLYSYNPLPSHHPVVTSFTREILVDRNGDEITVDSIVRWSTATAVGQSLELEDTFYNWIP